MNEASPEKPRRRAIGRTAAATAAVLGATLLAYPGGTASAQTDIDCGALGDDPGITNADDALAAAAECGVEVRMLEYSGPYSNLYATPEGQVHLVATVDPTQDNREFGAFDPSLVLSYGRLAQAHTVSGFQLHYDDADQPLARTANLKLGWTGTTPTPEYSGTTATYEGLATGLDLTVDVDASSANFQFAIADLDAWNALATGLTAKKDTNYLDLRAENGMLTLEDSSSWIGTTDHTTPFTVRDAAGTTTTAQLSRADDGSLTVSISEDALTEAVFPLTLSTQWAINHNEVNTWGAVTSAAPESALYRGEADLDQPYFEAAGESADAIVGPYCDALADATCSTTATAATFWNFPWADLPGRAAPDHYYDFTFPVASATFTIAADDLSACLAPDLLLTGEYTPAVTWDSRPDVSGTAASGACESGTAVYDVTESITDAWQGIEWGAGPSVTFGMAEGSETARFDGGSATLDAYFEVFGLDYSNYQTNYCAAYPERAPFFSLYPEYGGFVADIYPWNLARDDFSWTASFINSGTGEVAYTTETAALTPGTQPLVPTEAGVVPDGHYDVVYTITADSGRLEYRSDPCYLVIDTADPEILDYSVESGQHYVGEPVSIEVTVADEGFPGGRNTVRLGCGAGNYEPARDEVLLTDSATGTCEITPPTSDPWLSFWLWDKAGNYGSLETPGLRATHSRNDFNGDGHQDVMAVRESDGNMMFHAGKGDGTFKAGVSKGSGWGVIDAVMAGDLNGDDKADLLGRDTKTGYLYLYPGNGTGGLNSRVKVGSGWNAMGAFTSAGDFNNDGKTDVLAVRKSDGALYLYPGNGNGTFGTAAWVRSQVTSAWNGFDAITAPGDVNGDGYDDFLVHDARTGTYYLYVNNGTGQFHSRLTVSAALDGTGSDRFRQVVGAGDVDGDNYEDLLAIDSRTGELELHSLADNGTGLRAGKVVGTSWGGVRLPTADSDPTYDYSGDGFTDVLVRRGSDGKLYFYSGTGTGGFGPISSWGTDLKNLNLIETAGDLNGDGFSDLIGRVGSTGSLYLFPGKGNGTYDYAARKQIGTGWNAMSAIVSGHDYDGDGKTDLIAREKSTGYLWLYPGKGDGTIGTRVKIGAGWNGMRDITAAGDLDHDGHADIVAIRASDNCMYFYGGRGDGTLKPGVKTSCNWVGYDSLAAVGDFNGDGHADWLARRTSDGALYLYKGNGAGGYSSRTQIATGWTWANAIA